MRERRRLGDSPSAPPRPTPTKGSTTKDALKALEQAFAEAGPPDKIVCDEAPAFTCEAFKNFLATHGVALHVVPAYAHHSNGLAESFCKITGERIALMCEASLSRWDSQLKFIQLAINNSFSRSLGNTPFFLLHGYHPRPLNSNLTLPPQPEVPAADRLAKLNAARAAAETDLLKSHAQQARHYNSGRTAPTYACNSNEKTWREATITWQVNPRLPSSAGLLGASKRSMSTLSRGDLFKRFRFSFRH